MKSSINGGVNVSVADGWWAEGYDGANGYAVQPTGDAASEAHQLMEILENAVLPQYFGSAGGYGPEWLRMSRHAMRSLIPRFQGTRMLNDYVRLLYGPAAAHGRTLSERVSRGANEFSRWKKLVRTRWPQIELQIVATSPLQVTMALQGLHPEDVVVELLSQAGAVRLLLDREEGDRAYFTLPAGVQAGASGVVRAYPAHPWLAHKFETGRMIKVQIP